MLIPRHNADHQNARTSTKFLSYGDHVLAIILDAQNQVGRFGLFDTSYKREAPIWTSTTREAFDNNAVLVNATYEKLVIGQDDYGSQLGRKRDTSPGAEGAVERKVRTELLDESGSRIDATDAAGDDDISVGLKADAGIPEKAGHTLFDASDNCAGRADLRNLYVWGILWGEFFAVVDRFNGDKFSIRADGYALHSTTETIERKGRERRAVGTKAMYLGERSGIAVFESQVY